MKRITANRELDLTLLGDRVTYARRNRNLTQQELSEMTAMNPEEISRIETGARFPGTSKVVALAEALNISTDFILRGIGNPFPNHHSTN